jgi:ribonuclease PH
MDGVAISLADTLMGNIIRVDPISADTEACLQSIHPDLVILELSDPRADMMFSMLKTTPDILFLGLNEDCSRVIVLKTLEHTIYTMQDLQEILQSMLHWQPQLLEGGEHIRYQKNLDI